jgi:curved DNA-binding protein CbpA
MSADHYATLGVDRSAREEEIRRAYYRLVREHPPEKDPEGFKLIRTAYDTLSNPTARADYDAMFQYGDEISRLFAEAVQCEKEEQWGRAIPLLKRILVLNPSAYAARNQLGLMYLYLDQYDEAISIFTALTEKVDDASVYWANLGHGYSLKAKSNSANSYVRNELYEKARTYFNRAISLEEINSQLYIDISNTYLAQENYDLALKWAEKGIGADGGVDFRDFDAFMQICIIHLIRRDLWQVEQTANRIQALVTNDDEKLHVAVRFAMIGQTAGEHGDFEYARALLRIAVNFYAHEEIVKLYNFYSRYRGSGYSGSSGGCMVIVAAIAVGALSALLAGPAIGLIGLATTVGLGKLLG